MEKEITTTNQTTALADSLIVVQQLPIIKEQLHSIKAQAQESVKEALSLACTEETLKVVKERRAALNRDRKDLDVRRMAVKKQIMQPFEDFDEVYKECVTDVYGPADEALKGKITDVESGLKADKEKKVKDYFAEMVKASGVEWVTYEDPAEKFEDCFKRPFHIAYGQGKELAGARGEWLCFIVRGKNEFTCIAQPVDGVKVLPGKNYTSESLEAAHDEKG